MTDSSTGPDKWLIQDLKADSMCPVAHTRVFEQAHPIHIQCTSHSLNVPLLLQVMFYQIEA